MPVFAETLSLDSDVRLGEAVPQDGLGLPVRLRRDTDFVGINALHDPQSVANGGRPLVVWMTRQSSTARRLRSGEPVTNMARDRGGARGRFR